jgi:hypothetical protein
MKLQRSHLVILLGLVTLCVIAVWGMAPYRISGELRTAYTEAQAIESATLFTIVQPSRLNAPEGTLISRWAMAETIARTALILIAHIAGLCAIDRFLRRTPNNQQPDGQEPADPSC